MTRGETIQTILRSELQEWRSMSKDQVIEVLLMQRAQVLEEQNHDTLAEMLEEIDIAEVWGQAV